MCNRLLCAATDNRAEEVAALIARGVDVNLFRRSDDTSVLALACAEGHANVASLLLAAGAEVNKVGQSGATPLHFACNRGRVDCVSLLLSAGADVNKADANGNPPLWDAFILCPYLDVVKLLSSYGATREWPDGRTAEGEAANFNQPEALNWLVLTRHWTTPLHHLTVIDVACARALLRDGSNIHAAAPNVPDAPTPASLAHALQVSHGAPDGSPADLVLQAARPWSRQTHALFPARARERAWGLVLLGHWLSRKSCFAGEALMDVWLDVVMPHVVTRDSV